LRKMSNTWVTGGSSAGLHFDGGERGKTKGKGVRGRRLFVDRGKKKQCPSIPHNISRKTEQKSKRKGPKKPDLHRGVSEDLPYRKENFVER